MIELLDETEDRFSPLARRILAMLGSAGLSNSEKRVCLLIVDIMLEMERSTRSGTTRVG